MSLSCSRVDLPVSSLLGEAGRLERPAPLDDAVGYRVAREGDGIEFCFEPGLLAGKAWLAADFLLEGDQLAVLELQLQEGPDGPLFRMSFGLLNQCQARMRMPLSLTDQNVWMHRREGAWLKPLCNGDVVDPARVDRARLRLIRAQETAADFWMTPLVACDDEPPLLEHPLLPKGPLLDALGQSTLRNWPGKTGDADEMVERIKAQRDASRRQKWPDGFGGWGGWKAKPLGEKGFFRTHHDGRRWWLIDPEGLAFFSAGCNCVRAGIDANIEHLADALSWLPEADDPRFGEARRARIGGRTTMDYLRANLMRALGPKRFKTAWNRMVPGLLKQFGFNTVANWSDIEMASEARLPYVVPLQERFSRTPRIFRDMPDVYDERFALDLTDYAAQLEPLVDDRAMIGYFLMNEPTWGFAAQSPAAGMLYTTDRCESRNALAGWLRQRHGDDRCLAEAWQMDVTLDAVRAGIWHQPLTEAARRDLDAFSTILVEKLFAGMSQACRKVDPNHLNLGIRYYTVPPAWALEPMRRFDVFSMNCYAPRPPVEAIAPVSKLLNLPVILGEWHFGSLDAGLPASGIGHVRTQADRGRAYRAYLEAAAAEPWCVGSHWFTLYDQSALGRFDGENYNIGFLDVCHRIYDEIATAARTAHGRMYGVADGQAKPFADAPEYLERLFM